LRAVRSQPDKFAFGSLEKQQANVFFGEILSQITLHEFLRYSAMPRPRNNQPASSEIPIPVSSTDTT
jgi:hypothetical protein